MSDKRFFNLAIPAPARLALMRAAFENHAKKYPHCPEHAKPRTWRDIRAYTLGTWRAAFIAGLHQGRDIKNPIWYTHDGKQFRNEREAHKILDRLGHTGWFTDVHEYETACGIIANLPHGRFIAGYTLSDSGERVYYPQVFTDEREAAYMSDEHARVYAENAREYSEKYEAARELELEIEEKRGELCKLFEIRNIKGKHWWEHPRELIRELIEEIREMQETLKNEYSGVY